jgi:hypothetical protein
MRFTSKVYGAAIAVCLMIFSLFVLRWMFDSATDELTVEAQAEIEANARAHLPALQELLQRETLFHAQSLLFAESDGESVQMVYLFFFAPRSAIEVTVPFSRAIGDRQFEVAGEAEWSRVDFNRSPNDNHTTTRRIRGLDKQDAVSMLLTRDDNQPDPDYTSDLAVEVRSDSGSPDWGYVAALESERFFALRASE